MVPASCVGQAAREQEAMNSNRAVVIDRWMNKDGKRTGRYGVGMRWRARFVDDQGREQTKAFARKVDARAWLDDVITALGTGSYTTPEAGRATVASVYAAWSATQAHISPKTSATRRSAWGSRVEPAWGGVAVVDIRSSAVRAWVQQLVDDGAGVPIIENAFGLLRQVLGAAVEDRRIPRNPCDSIETGRGGIVNPRVARSLLEEGSYCDDELMAEYLGGLLAAGRSPTGRDDRAVSWTALVASMSAIQLRLHFILYREWAYAIHGMEDETITGSQNVATIYMDANQVIAALREDHPEIGNMSVALHALAGLARLDLIGNQMWNVGGVRLIRQRHPVPDLPFTAAIEAVPTHAGMELYGWACGRPGYSFHEFMTLDEVIEFDVDLPRPTAVLPYLKPGEGGAGLAPPTGDDG
jgi:hypothetical protein